MAQRMIHYLIGTTLADQYKITDRKARYYNQL